MILSSSFTFPEQPTKMFSKTLERGKLGAREPQDLDGPKKVMDGYMCNV